MNGNTDNVIDMYSRQPISQLTPKQLFCEIYESILEMWYHHEDEDSLNAYITSCIPKKYAIKGADYRNDLNAISQLEASLGMVISILFPGVSEQNPDSIIISFYENDEVYSAHILPFEDDQGTVLHESYCRALNVVIYISFQLAKKQYNLPSYLEI